MEEIIINIDGKEHRVKVEENESGKIKVHFEGSTYEVNTKQEIEETLFEDKSDKGSGDGKNIVTAPLPGTISEIKVKPGDKVKDGQPLIKLIAMKMENEIVSQIDATVKEVKVKVKETVEKGAELIILG